MDYLQRYDIWCKEPLLTEDERASLIAMTAEDDRKGAFGAELQFGTAGIRGIMGLGTNRLNDYTVARATQGLADYLNQTGGKQVAIAYDSRLCSDTFAHVAAGVLANNGLIAHVYPRLMPTPMLSFAVRELGCDAGVVITASHNPAQYNGYKVYGSDGCQITEEAAEALALVNADLRRKGLRLVLYDGYRPQQAVDHFVRWAESSDESMRPIFYPDVDKADLFTRGFIARRSGHSRGSTIDLTLLDEKSGALLDMGGPFDFFGKISHPDSPAVTPQQHENRYLLREAMLARGFKPLSTEWWHFTLVDEPYPDTYFDFPVR